MSPEDACLLGCVLCGQPRKTVACDLGMAPSTVAGRLRRALAKLALGGAPVPLPLVLAAQTWAGISRVVGARSARFDYRGRRYLVVDVPRPATSRVDCLTPAEQEVLACFLEGFTRRDIARRRSTSVRTVAVQIHSIFTALRASGRYALIRRAAELDCFSRAIACDSRPHEDLA